MVAREDWADELAREIIDEVSRLNRDSALEIVAGRLRDAHRAGQLQAIGEDV